MNYLKEAKHMIKLILKVNDPEWITAQSLVVIAYTLIAIAELLISKEDKGL